MYVLRSKVTLEPADDLMLIGLSGPEAERLIRQFAGDAPENANDCVQTDQCTVVRLPGPFPRFEVILTIDDAMRIWTSWKSIAQPCGASTWAWLDIMAGLPTVLPETSEAFVPQMANLELIGGVNFKKGCYPGQEIVARMQYLGRLKQRMFRAHVQAETPPRPGMDVYADDFGDQAAGTVVDAQPSPRGGYDMLVVMQIGSARPANVHLGRREGAILAIETLSYAMTA
jgi:folate-binding protein YgfZ